jgi:peptidoglycan/LPS O-acetylase OafA/YrhL
MMPLSTFNILLVVVVLLVIYAWVDHHNKLYGNIAAAIVASLTGALLAILVYMGAVQTDSGVTVSDFPTAGIMLLFSILIAVYAFFMAWDAKDEYEEEQERL